MLRCRICRKAGRAFRAILLGVLEAVCSTRPRREVSHRCPAGDCL